MSSAALPVLSSDVGLSNYLAEIRKFPMLSQEEEFALAKRLQNDGDVEAAHTLVTSHMRLVAKIAMGFRGYGLPLMDLIAEGNIGLMQAVKKFDPDKGFRLSTYAMWWIKASIQEYILRSWSLVKIGTTAAQKKLFFNLRKLKNKIQETDHHQLLPGEAADIANTLDVKESEVYEMDSRMTMMDSSLNDPIGNDMEGTRTEMIDQLADEDDNQESMLAEFEDISQKRALLANAMTILNPREKHILEARRLQEKPVTLDDLSQEYGISRERVRQIEARAFEKLQQHVSS